MDLKIISSEHIEAFDKSINSSIDSELERLTKIDTPVDYFDFYRSISSVYSSRIEGVSIEYDSFFKHKFLGVKFKPDYTKRTDDLFAAYQFIDKKEISLETVCKVHNLLFANILPKTERGKVRKNPMLVINNEEKIEYVAADPALISSELVSFFLDVEYLTKERLSISEVFYYAAYIHLVFVKIHPFQDGNGRTGRLLEKWFLQLKLGEKVASIQLEKHYYLNLASYYKNLRKLGLEYDVLDYSKCLDFLLMTVNSLNKMK